MVDLPIIRPALQKLVFIMDFILFCFIVDGSFTQEVPQQRSSRLQV